MDRCSADWDHVSEAQTMQIVKALKLEMKSLAKTRREQITPLPMDIGNVDEADKKSGEEEPDYWASDVPKRNGESGDWSMYGDCDVNAIGKGGWKGFAKGKGKGKGPVICYGCGESGHIRRDCRKGAGKGKFGGKGGQWFPQAAWQGKGTNGKGTTLRACFQCGALDHLIGSCPHVKAV